MNKCIDENSQSNSSCVTLRKQVNKNEDTEIYRKVKCLQQAFTLKVLTSQV